MLLAEFSRNKPKKRTNIRKSIRNIANKTIAGASLGFLGAGLVPAKLPKKIARNVHKATLIGRKAWKKQAKDLVKNNKALRVSDLPSQAATATIGGGVGATKGVIDEVRKRSRKRKRR